MNVEIMKLQKDNGVSVFGGCIPQHVFGNRHTTERSLPPQREDQSKQTFASPASQTK